MTSKIVGPIVEEIYIETKNFMPPDGSDRSRAGKCIIGSFFQ
jgi:hypothetical protein